MVKDRMKSLRWVRGIYGMDGTLANGHGDPTQERNGRRTVASPGPKADLWTWVFRILLALAALVGPIIVFRIFTDSELPDPQKEQRLHEATTPRP
jgi:hypothetical protein